MANEKGGPPRRATRIMNVKEKCARRKRDACYPGGSLLALGPLSECLKSKRAREDHTKTKRKVYYYFSLLQTRKKENQQKLGWEKILPEELGG